MFCFFYSILVYHAFRYHKYWVHYAIGIRMMSFCLPYGLLLSFLLIVNVILCYSIITSETFVKPFKDFFSPCFLCMERITGFEPVPTAWKAVMLPLHHIRMNGSLLLSTTDTQESRLCRCGSLFILANSD